MRNKSIFLSLLVFLSLSIKAEVILPAIFNDGMVLQRESKVAIWGWDTPKLDMTITCSWNSDTVVVRCANTAKWRAQISTPKAGGPYTITIKGSSTKVLTDVLSGEVWLCSGQSNMEWNAAKGYNNSRDEVANANYPNLRLFQVTKIGAESPQNTVVGNWAACSPTSVKEFSAIAYFFGRHLQDSLKMPIGLINASWGGTPAEAWLPEAKVLTDDFLAGYARKLKKAGSWPVEAGRSYNGMIAPIIPFGLAGVIWYQGESNAYTSESYGQLFKMLIGCWREKFDKELPFYYVQIAPFTYWNDSTQRPELIREAQAATLEVPKTGMVVVTDLVDNIKDIHPRNKQDVGKRLANLALNNTYGYTSIVAQSPIYKGMQIEKNKIRISFKYASAGLVRGAKVVPLLEIAGVDKKFSPAVCKIDGDELVVWSKSVPKPVAVRYAFCSEAISNLSSVDGLPVSPFRTDGWDDVRSTVYHQK